MKKILVIDDEEWLREMVHMALQRKGFDVIEAENGAAGIETARRELPDLILCDVNMEKVNGYLTLSALRSEPATAAIPFILMTGLADNAGMRHGMELGADDYLPKPFAIEALYAAVDARLRKAQALRQQAEKKLADLRDNISMMLPHELRTPLNGIIAYGEILSTGAANLPPAEIAEMGQVIYQSGKRLERLVENFLIYAQIELLGADPQKVSALRSKADVGAGQTDRGPRPRPGRGCAPDGRPGPGACRLSRCRFPKTTWPRSWRSWFRTRSSSPKRAGGCGSLWRPYPTGWRSRCRTGAAASRPSTSPKSGPTCSSTARCRNSRGWGWG